MRSCAAVLSLLGPLDLGRSRYSRSCDLIALPDELLLSCVDKSLRTCVMLAGTSKAIRAKLSYQAKERGLRLMCYSA